MKTKQILALLPSFFLVAVVASVATSVAAGCSSSTTTTTTDDAGLESALDASAGDGSSFFTTVDSGSCNTVDNAAPPIPFAFSATIAPAPAGGTIVDGTYFLTSAVDYTMLDAGVTAAELGTIQSTLVIESGVAQTVTFTTLSMATERATASYTPSGSAVLLTDSCPDTKSTSSSYTATATTVQIFDESDPAAVSVETYTKQ